jgi:ABC-type amino acid transport substrate-binding protein
MQRAGSMIAWMRLAQFACLALTAPVLVPPAHAQQKKGAITPPTTTLERIKVAGQIRLGYRDDARPFSYRDQSGKAAGYSVALCLAVVDAIKAETAMPSLKVEWVPVTLTDRFSAVQQGKIDLLCGAESETLARRADVAFSIPIFPGGIGALLRSDATARLKEVLSGRPSTRPNWRAQAGQLLQVQRFMVIAGTTAEPWLAGKLKEFKLTAKVTPVKSYEEGAREVVERRADVFFGDRAILLDAARQQPLGKLIVLDRYFTYESVALAMARGDETFRLAVDRALSRFYASGDLPDLYEMWFGEPGPEALTFFRWNALPD